MYCLTGLTSNSSASFCHRVSICVIFFFTVAKENNQNSHERSEGDIKNFKCKPYGSYILQGIAHRLYGQSNEFKELFELLIFSQNICVATMCVNYVSHIPCQ